MLLVANSPKKSCGCHGGLGCGCHGGGLGFMRRRRGLGQSASDCTDPSSVSAACVAYLKTVAQANGVDPSAIDAGVAAGLDSIQLLFIANKTSGVYQELSAAQTVNQDVGSSNYPTVGGGSPPSPPPTNWLNQDSLGLGMTNGTYLLIGGVGLVGLSLVKKFL